MKNWRLGLDLGTNSIGWCALQLDDDSPSKIIDMGVRVFHDGREPKTGESLAVQRRLARGVRRRRDRHNRQKRKVFGFFLEAGLISKAENESLKQIDPYHVRTKGLDSKLSPAELARAFYHLVVRRGFKSNRKDERAADSELSVNLKKIETFSKQLKESGYRTLGEYLYNQKKDGKTVRFRPESSEFYPERSMYETEFYLLKSVQEKFYPELEWDKLYDIIFFQRPLAKQEKGKCQFYTDKERAYKALVSSQRFRILQDINNLMMLDELGQKIGLSYEEKELLLNKLDNCNTMNFNKIRSLIKTENKFNLESRSDIALNGNSTSFKMRKQDLLGELWDSLEIKEQDSVVEVLIDAENDDEVLDVLKKWPLSDKQIENILNTSFSSGVTKLSKEFMYDCIEKMEGGEWLPYHEAVTAIGLHHSDFNNREELLEKLPYYGQLLKGSTIGARPGLVKNPEKEAELLYGKIGNPTVHVALNQLQKLVNALIDRFGRPDEIVVELSRELKQSREAKAEIAKKQKENKKTNDRIRKEFKEEGIEKPSSWDYKKFKLWEELGHSSMSRRCVYCGKNISRTQLVSNQIEIEHILPFSRTLMNAMSNLTVSHRTCNQVKGNRTPHEAFSSDPDGFEYQAILERASHLPKSKYMKFLPNALEEWEKTAGFQERQLTDNAYLSRKAKEYLSAICPFNKIWTIKGGQTAVLRANWGLNKLLSSSNSNWYKNREDHRHHSIDALVIALTDRGMIKKMSDLNRKNLPMNIQSPPFPFLRADIQDKLHSMLVSIKPDHGPEGKLFNETALGLKQLTKRVSLSDFSEEKEIDWIDSKNIRKRFKELCRDTSFNNAKKIMGKEWAENNDTEGPFCRVPTWVSRKNLSTMNKKELERIWDYDLKKKIFNEIPVEGLNEKQLAGKLEEFASANNIRHIRFIPDNTATAYPIKSVDNKKAYIPNDYLYVVVWGTPPNENEKKWKYSGYFVNRVQANDPGFNVNNFKPHPAAKKMDVLYKNDVIEIIEENDVRHYGRIAGYAATNNKIDLQSIYSSNNMQDWHDSTNKNLTDSFFKPIKGQCHISINALWTKYSIRKISISVDGRGRSRMTHVASDSGDCGGGEVPVI